MKKLQPSPPPTPDPPKASIVCPTTGDVTYVEWCKENCPETCGEFNELTKE